jgi:DNA (cytosine-5)-methyltransferase 1
VRIGSLFSGYGGLDRGVQAVLGGTVAWHSEIDPGACKILAHHYPDVPNHGDITAVDWSAVEPVDVLTGGFPCQDVSAAGKRAGLHSETRSGLWAQMVRAIDELRPSLVVAENVRGLLSACALSELEPCPRCLGDESQPHRSVLRALGRVVGDLSELGYVGRWGGLRAADVGSPHGRFRVFIVAWPAADTSGAELQRRRVTGVLAGTEGASAGARDQRERDGHAVGGGRAASANSGSEALGLGTGLCASDTAGFGWTRPDDGGASTGDTDRQGLEGWRPGRGRTHERALGSTGLGSGAGAWGIYAAAVRNWEHCLGRAAPAPTESGPKGGQRLSARAVEWMMGLSDGWVTDVPGLGRNEQLKALGNGVVPQQCAAALRLLLPDMAAPPVSLETGGAA